MSEARVMPVRQSSNELNLSWRDRRYVKFYKVVDELVDELQQHVWIKKGKPRLLKSLINSQHTPQFKQKDKSTGLCINTCHIFFSNLFNSQRSLAKRTTFKLNRDVAFAEWRSFVTS